MKQFFLLSGFLLLAPICLAPVCARAQVTIYPAALAQLAGISAPPPPAPIAVSVPVLHHWRPARHFTPAVAHAKAPAPMPVAARVVPPPPEPAKPAAPKPLAPLTLAFAPGSADLPANATAALKPFCAAPGQVAIDARAPSDPSDPSAAMRLSLSRAMAVQAALTACGVPPQNILPRANGDVPGKNEDETVIGGGAEK